MKIIPCDELEKLNIIGELKGQIMDIIEDFLAEKGIEIPNPEKEDDPDAAILYGEDYDRLADPIEDTLRNWGFFDNELRMDTPAGELVAFAYDSGNQNYGAGVMLKPKDVDDTIDLLHAKVYSKEETERIKENTRNSDIDIDTVHLFVHADVMDEDATSSYVITRKDIDKLKDSVNDDC